MGRRLENDVALAIKIVHRGLYCDKGGATQMACLKSQDNVGVSLISDFDVSGVS